MTTPTHIPTADQRSALLDAVLRLLERQLPSQPTYICPEQHRILFRTADDRTGSVDVLINFDVVQSVTQNAAGENYSAPAPTEPAAVVHLQAESTKAA